MRTLSVIASLLGTLLLVSAPAPAAAASGAGGAEFAPAATGGREQGGARYGAGLRELPGRPRIRVLRLRGARVTAGRAAMLLVRIERRAARSVRIRVVTEPARGPARRLAVRRIPTRQTVRIALPRTLRVGRHRVRVEAFGGAGEARVRSRAVTLHVRPKPRPRPRPAPVSERPASPVPQKLGGRGTASGVFPVQGRSTFGGAGSRFGAGRTGHTHEGQDIAAAAGTPVVAPLPGSVLFNAYQAGGAGRYVVLGADNGWHMFFAHCLAGSATVTPGQRVAAGQRLCLVGSTGSASGPHLHFELWPDGWRHLRGTRPIDPLPTLRAWAR